MADSIITVSGLRATGGINQIALSWNNPVDPHVNGLTYLRFDVTEVWKSAANNRSAPVFVGETSGNVLTELNVPRGSRFYYWIRTRDRSRLYGEWFPVSPTAGVVGLESNVIDALLEPQGFIRHADGTVEEWGNAISANAIVDGAAKDGVVDVNFQTTFTEIFGVNAIGKLEYIFIPSNIPPFETQNVFVSLTSLTTTQMRLKTVLVTTSSPPVGGFNGIRAYWRVFGK